MRPIMARMRAVWSDADPPPPFIFPDADSLKSPPTGCFRADRAISLSAKVRMDGT